MGPQARTRYVYPKDFFGGSQLVPEPGTCFLVMPFSPAFDAVFTSIKNVLEGDLGVPCVRTDELLGGGNIIEDILRGIATSELVVVDVTGRNPNVFYELGIAHMCKPKEKVILLSQERDSIPFDLRPFRHILYQPTDEGLQEMSTTLRQAVDAVREKIHRIVLDGRGHGELPDRLMGKDGCLYGFEINGTGVGYNAAKVSLRVTRYVIGAGQNRESGDRSATLRSACVFNEGIAVYLGKPLPIWGTEWSILLDRGCFRIIQTKTEPLPLAKGGRAPSSARRAATGKRAKRRIAVKKLR